MALVFDATVGGSSANSLSTLETANSYYDRVPSTWLHAAQWALANDDKKKLHLVMATELLRTRYTWKGSKKTTTQRLPFPRISLYDLDGIYVDDSSIPELVSFATAELAGQLMLADRTLEAATKGIERMKVDIIEFTFDKHDRSTTIPESVSSMLATFGSELSGNSPVKMVTRY